MIYIFNGYDEGCNYKQQVDLHIGLPYFIIESLLIR